MSAKEEYEKAMEWVWAASIARIAPKQIEAYVTELEQRCEELEKERDVFKSCLEFTARERDGLLINYDIRLKKYDELKARIEELEKDYSEVQRMLTMKHTAHALLLTEHNKLRARIEGSQKVWLKFLLPDFLEHGCSYKPDDASRYKEYYAVPVLETEEIKTNESGSLKEEHEK